MVWHPLGDGRDVSGDERDGSGEGRGAAPDGGEGSADGPKVPILPLGDPTGPPVVVVPGLTDGLHPVSQPAGRRLFDELPVPMDRCRGLVVSYRHPLTGAVTTAGLAADLAEVIDARVGAPVVLIAHSMGTMVAQHLAARRPDLVAGMVLSAPLVDVDDEVRTVIERWAALVRDGRWAEFTDDALACSYTGAELARRRERSEALPPDAPDEALRRRYLRLSEACLGHDASEVLAEIRAPALVLAGEEDPIAPPHHARRLAAALHDAELHVLPGLAHGFPEEAASHFTAFVTAFLGEVAGRTAAWVGTDRSVGTGP